MTAVDRSARTRAADALCAGAYDDAGGTTTGVALVAVGGYGRSELAPQSDLDVVLVHDEGVDIGVLGEKLWYPLWDSGARLDHSVRSLPQMVEAAAGDLKVALGLLDVRHLTGDPHLTLRLRTTMLAAWRREAPERLPALATLVRGRHELVGELAHVSVPDLKEAEGGLRDATVLKALVATWLVDVPHADLERSRRALLDVRDVLHRVTGRATDRIAPEVWSELAAPLGLRDAVDVQLHVRVLGRRIAHLSRLTWRRVEGYLARPVSVTGARRPGLVTIAPGVAVASGEVVLEAGARPDRDPLLLLRAAAEAAERDLVLAPPTAARLAREGAALSEPWPHEARQLLVRLLAAGQGLLHVWETLEETGALDRILPEWERIRLLPHASPIHRFTVDRHVVETCREASSLIRTVSRPDVLMVAALLHDIGKGDLTEHSVAGEPLARSIATRMGFDAESVHMVGLLVRWHLLLSETATTRDPDDPATVERVTARIGTAEGLTLLLALTQADAKATSHKAWSRWRAGLVLRVGAAALNALDTGVVALAPPAPAMVIPEAAQRGGVSVEVEPTDDGARVIVIAPDRVGLLADGAAMLALQRTSVRAARAWGQGEYGVAVWEVANDSLDATVLRQRFVALASGRLDARARLTPTDRGGLVPTVAVRPEAARAATVLEVRAADRPGVLYLVLAALADLDIAVRSAHMDTLGPQAVDVFYVQEANAGALSDERASEAAHAVRAALTPPG
ncbi:MAG: [protein-PII] uridylyltransferase [Nocardioides sp.]